VAKPGPVPAAFVKNYELVTKRPDLARADFDEYWARVHGPLGGGDSRRSGATSRRTCRPARGRPARRPLDGLAITWFDDVAAMRAGTRTEAYAKTRADERNFLAGELTVRDNHRAGYIPARGTGGAAREPVRFGSDRTVQSSRRSPVTKRWAHRAGRLDVG